MSYRVWVTGHQLNPALFHNLMLLMDILLRVFLLLLMLEEWPFLLVVVIVQLPLRLMLEFNGRRRIGCRRCCLGIGGILGLCVGLEVTNELCSS